MATDFRVEEQKTYKNGKETIYKLLVLKNEMKVMLIHDDTLTETFVALDVHIGNFSNPDDFPGLAHLCQQMIVLNSLKYPKYKQFQKFVQTNWGKKFLTTSSDHSTYYFRINTKDDSAVKEALDRFAQFFLYEPLLHYSWIEKEIESMDLELQKELQHETAWFSYFEKFMIETAHPYSKYGLCKKKILEQLTVEVIQSRLLSFFRNHYSANIMTLCIVSGCTLDKIEKMLAGTFCQIKNREIKIPETFEDPFKNQLCTMWHIAPKRFSKYLKLIFPLPEKTEEIVWRPAVDCISYFLESNHKNSILEILKAEGWCDSISTIGYQEAKNLNYFHVTFKLLSDAYLYADDIISLFFKYLELFKNRYLTSRNDQLELKKILQNMFKCKIFEEEQTFSQQRIIQIVKHLHKYSMEDILFNPYSKQFHYTVKLINMILDKFISPETIRVYLITDEMRHPSKDMSPREWNNAGQSYKKWKISKSRIHTWMNPFYSKLLSFNSEFWPSPNNLFYQKLPIIIKNTPLINLWYMPTIRKSNKIKPYSKMIFYFISPQVNKHVFNDILNTIFTNAIKAAFKLEDLFKSTQWQLMNTKSGLLLEVTNCDPKRYQGFLPTILRNIFMLTMGSEFNTYVETSKRKFEKNLASFVKLQPMEHASFYLAHLLSEISFTHEEALEISAYVTIDEIRKFVKKFLKDIYIKGLIYGDISMEEALQVTRDFDELDIGLDVTHVNAIPKPYFKKTHLRCFICCETKLEDGTHVLFEIENEFHNFSCIQVYYQIGQDTMDLNSKLALVHYIMSEKCSVYFEKFGDLINGTYVKMRKAGGTRGLIIIVESSMNPYTVQYHIEQFIFYLLDYIRQLSRMDFRKYKTQLITCSKMPKLQNIGDALWKEDFTGLYFFDGPGTEKKYIKDIKQKELVTFYEQFICEKSALLSVHVLPKHKNNSKKENSSEIDLKRSKTDSEGSSSDQSESLNETNQLISIDNRTNTRVLTNTINKKFTCYIIPEEHFKKIDDILVFKQNRDFYC